MKINKDNFYKKVMGVMPATENNITLKIEKGSSKMVVSSVKNSFAIYLTVNDIEDAKPMHVQVDASYLRDILGAVNGYTLDETITLTILDANRFEISAGNGTVNFKVPFVNLEGTDIDGSKSKEKYVKEIKVKSLGAYINGTKHAIETRDSIVVGPDARRASFFVEVDAEDNIRVSTTDGHRVSLRQGAMKEVVNEFVIPSAEMKTAISLLGKDVTLRIPKDGEFFQMVGEDTLIVMPLLNSKFFPIQNVIDDVENKKALKIVVDKHELLCKCKCAVICEKKVVFGVVGKKITMGTTSACREGGGEMMIDEKDPDGKNIRVGFSLKYLIEALESLNSNRVEMMFSNNRGVCKIEPHLEEGQEPKPGRAVEIVLPIAI